MTKPITGEQESTDTEKAAMKLSEAVRIVRSTIAQEEFRLAQIATDGQEHNPILLEGETCKNIIVRFFVDPSQVVQILLDYEYPIYKVLEEDFPQEMWDALARMAGLKKIYSVDI